MHALSNSICNYMYNEAIEASPLKYDHIYEYKLSNYLDLTMKMSHMILILFWWNYCMIILMSMCMANECKSHLFLWIDKIFFLSTAAQQKH